MRSVTIRMKSGDVHHVTGFAERVQQRINEARGGAVPDLLIDFERDLVPTGQMIWLDPTEVESVKDDR